MTNKRLHSPRPARRRRTGALGAVLLAAAALPALAPIPPGDELGVDDTRAALEKMIETRRIISAERRDWRLGKEMLDDRIEVVQREIESLRERITEANDTIAETDKKAADLVAENERHKQAATALREMVDTLEDRTKALLARLPDPIRERVKPISQSFPDDQENTKASLSTRFQNVVGILNEVNKFNREITVTSEVRTLPDGTTAEVTALYVGIGQGYYVSGDGTAAGIGSATEDAWEWRAANEAATDIQLAVAILKNEAGAAFVQLPIRID